MTCSSETYLPTVYPASASKGVRHCPHDTTVPVCKRVDGQQVQHEQADQQHHVVSALSERVLVSVDELDGEVLGAGCRDGDESDLNRPVRLTFRTSRAGYRLDLLGWV
jgi:hypothetical protein